jgi:hypothetical protein
MAIIGNNTAGVAVILDNDDSYLHNVSSEHLPISVAQEAFKFWLYSGSPSSANNGKTAKMGIYDVTSGANISPLVGAIQTFNGDADEGWMSVDITGSEIPLEVGKTYGVGIWSDVWVVDVSGGWQSNNNIRDENTTTLPSTFVLDTTSYNGGAIAMYVETRLAVAAPEITDVNSGNSIADGDTSITITGTAFAASGNTVTISPSTDINHIDAVVQSAVSNESTTSVDITVELPVGSTSEDFVYLFVTDDSSNVSSGYSVSVSPLATSLHTLTLSAECTSTDFALGITAYKNKGEVDEEIASVVTAIDTLPTASPQYNCTFETGDPVSPDTLELVYDAAVGDIRTTSGDIPLASITYTAGTVCP